MRSLLLVLILAAHVGCISDCRSGLEDYDRFVEICRELATTQVESDGPLAKVDWMVHPCTASTQEFRKDYKVTYADADYLSFRAEEFCYRGGAHGMTTITVGTLDRKTGQILKLDHFVPANRLTAVEKLLYEGVLKKIGGKDHLQGEVRPIENFCIEKDGLHFVYNEYEVACYACGAIEVVVPLSALDEN